MSHLGRRLAVALAISAPCAALALFAQARYCPPRGCAVTPSARALDALKNRTTTPDDADFDRRATLGALAAAGDDRARWSESRAAAFEGYVVSVERGGVESANCFSLTRRDVHIHVAARPDAPPTETVVVEVSPRFMDAARARGDDWSLAALRRALVGHRCRFEGWLLFDREHAGESENTAPGNPVDWRATAWELHPVSRIEIVN
ncbi:MAG: hypothetical protein LC746_12815 [Acidobacteria bacterium]|nr:hypothetical protein [Acidobacteriota bacterium]